MNSHQSGFSKRDFLRSGFVGITGCILGLDKNLFRGTFFQSSDGIRNEPWKWSKEGMFYEQTPRGARCMICPNECVIKEGNAGDCRSRIAYNGKVYSIAYGNPCAVHVDPIEKKPLYHFLPGTRSYSIATAGCNLACLNCQNWTISQASPKDTRNYDLMPDKVVEEALNKNCKSISYTYSEPVTFYEYTYDSSIRAKKKGIKNVFVSAGYIHEKPLRTMAKVIDAANIDLKSFKDETYLRLNGGQLQPVLNTLKILKEEGVWIEITNLIIPGWTDDLEMIKKMCGWLTENGFSDNPLHFSRFHPQYKLTQLPPTPANTLHTARETAIKEGMNYVYIGNVPESSAENTICPNCKKTVLGRKGFSIVANHIIEGNCSFCNRKIAGIWS
jgi:pyruvate formate lyase activating enzyme